MKPNWLKFGATSALVAAALAGACSSDHPATSSMEDASGGKASGGAGKPSGTSGSNESDAGSAGSSVSSVTEAIAESGAGGSAGAAGAEDAGASGMPESAAAGGSSGHGGASGGSAGTAGTSGSAGHAGSGGSAGHAGTGGTGGSAGHAGTSSNGGTSSSGGSAGHAGTGGAPPVLFIPASLTCADGNVVAAMSVCRNCHGSTPNSNYAVPFMLVTYADVYGVSDQAASALQSGAMPLPGAGSLDNFASASNCSTGGATSCKAVLQAWLDKGAPGVTNAACP